MQPEGDQSGVLLKVSVSALARAAHVPSDEMLRALQDFEKRRRKERNAKKMEHRSPLLGCKDGGAVVTSVKALAKVTHVQADELLEALNQASYDSVEVLARQGSVVISEVETTPQKEEPGKKLARVVHGGQIAAEEATPLLDSSRPWDTETIFTPVSVIPSTANSPATSVSLVAPSQTPDDALFLIPMTETSSCVIVPAAELFESDSWYPKLPTAISQVRSIGIKDGGFYYVVIEYTRPVVAWAILISGVAGLASKAVVADMMYPPSVPAVVKMTWMSLISTLCFVLLASFELAWRKKVFSRIASLFDPRSVSCIPFYVLGTKEPALSSQSPTNLSCFSLIMLLLAGILQGSTAILFFTSLRLTSLPEALVFGNLHPLLILLSRCTTSSRLEWIGVTTTVVGIVALCRGSPLASEGPNPFLGNTLAGLSSVTVWLYLNLSQRLQEELSNGVLMTSLGVMAFLVQVSAACLEGEREALQDEFTLYSLPNFLGGFFGTAVAFGGFMVAGKYLKPLVISIHITLEPLFGVAIGILAGRSIPSPAVLEALVVLLAGTIIVSVGGKNERDCIEITDRESSSPPRRFRETDRMMSPLFFGSRENTTGVVFTQ